MIIWLNGAFGGGKTTTARELVRVLGGSRLFDTESIGSMVAANLPDHEFTDFQQLPPWRSLVPTVLEEISRFTRQHLVVPQSVLTEEYWGELRDGLRRRSLDLFHIVLHLNADVLTERIDRDLLETEARQWRSNHVDAYEEACEWLVEAADLVIDSTALSAVDVAGRIVAAVTERRSG